jgi:hypothetical protein
MLKYLGIASQLVAVDINPEATHATKQTLFQHQESILHVPLPSLMSAEVVLWHETT